MTSERPSRDPICEAALGFMDSLLKEEAPPGAGRPELLQHIKECAHCSREFALRSAVGQELKRTVEAQPDAPFLEAKIRRALQQEREGRTTPAWVWRLVATAAVLIVCLATVTSYRLGHLRLTRASQDSYIASISTKVAGIFRVGLGDHVHCAVFRKLPKQAPARATLAADLGPEYSDVLMLVQQKLPAEYKVVMAHRCSYRGRHFIHLALKSDTGLLSLVMSRKRPGESFGSDDLLPALSESGIPIYRTAVQRFAIAGFESGDHLAYLVSDLDDHQNLNLMAILAPSLSPFLAKIPAV